MHVRFLTAGESHGPALTALIEGIPHGLSLNAEYINQDLHRRQKGYGRSGRMKIERDSVEFLAGVRKGYTLGSPIVMQIKNHDHVNWPQTMGQEAPLFQDLDPKMVKKPRPGHADLGGGLKYHTRDLRDVLERASARETASRVAVGAVCRRLLEELHIEVCSHVIQIGGIEIEAPSGLSFHELKEHAFRSELSCIDKKAESKMKALIHQCSHEGDTLGGAFEIVATNMLPGLGSHIQWDKRLDGKLAQALMSIPAIKAVEIGLGFEGSKLRGSEVHDPISYLHENERQNLSLGPSQNLIPPKNSSFFTRKTNHAGGIEGGMSNGEPLLIRVGMKPISSLRKALPSVHIDTKLAEQAAFERSDICAVPAASVVGEAMVLYVLADCLLEKFGSDSLVELKRHVQSYVSSIQTY